MAPSTMKCLTVKSLQRFYRIPNQAMDYLEEMDSNVERAGLARHKVAAVLAHLSKIIERAVLDQLVPFLEEVGVVPRYLSAYRKLHSTETALCKIHDDLVSNTCHGKASILVLLDLSAVLIQWTISYSRVIFLTVELRALHCLCLNLTLKTGNSSTVCGYR